jgi:Sortase domain
MRHPERRRAVALAAAVVFALGSGAAVTWVLTHQEHAPQPSAAAAGSVDVKAAGPHASKTAGDTAVGPVLQRSVPKRISIPAIHVTSRVRPLGLARNGALAVPQPGPHYNEAAWFKGSPTPGQEGPAIMEGHVDSAAQGPSVFFRLGALRPGDRVYVARADRSVATFTVNGVRRYAKDAFPTSLVYGNTNHAALRLITCGGAFDGSTGHYVDNIVVFAHLTATT